MEDFGPPVGSNRPSIMKGGGRTRWGGGRARWRGRRGRAGATWPSGKLVVLCDISGSMEPYARAMLQLLYCAAGGARAEVFCFATRLTRLTTALAQARPGRALQEAGQAAPDWLGGTRIGASLEAFNDGFGQRGLARGPGVVVVSDRWDTGGPAEVPAEVRARRRVAGRSAGG